MAVRRSRTSSSDEAEVKRLRKYVTKNHLARDAKCTDLRAEEKDLKGKRELFGCASWARVGALRRLLNACSEKCDSGRVMATGESREEEQRLPSRCISILLKKASGILCQMTRVEFLRDAERLACDMQCERARVTKKGRYLGRLFDR